MIRKIFGAIFCLIGFVILVLGFVDGSIGSDYGSFSATYGAFAGAIIPVLLYFSSGVFLFTFDNANKKSYIDGFKFRKKQCNDIIVYMVMFGLFFILSCALSVVSENVLMSIISAAIYYLVPLLFFAGMFSVYVLPFSSCRKKAPLDDALLEQILSVNETFYACSSDNSVLTSNKVLFFPKMFCVIPINWIASIKLLKNPFEEDVVFTLTNGKKITVVSKEFKNIEAAINAYRSANVR